MKIAIAGNIASGKSTVQKLLEDSGYKVLDTDKCGHQALKLPQVKQALSEFDIFENNEISRTKLGQLVFNNPDIKIKLENIVHPIIKQDIIRFFEQNKDEKLIFVAIPLVFEAHMEDLFDKIVFVYTEDDLRIKRLIERNNYDEEYALLRIKSQISQEEKLKHCDYVINNSGSITELQLQVNDLLKKLV